MTASTLARPVLTGGRHLGASSRVVSVLAVVGIAIGGAVLTDATVARLVVAVSAGAVFFLVANNDRILAAQLGILFLVLLGFIRRFLIPFAGWSESDPLLLVGPAVAVLLINLAPRVSGRPLTPGHRDALTPLVLFLVLMSFAQATNPAQSSLLVGVQGLLFWVGPLLWFFVGKSFDLEAHRRIRRMFLWSMVPVLALGYYHSFIGFLPFELTWVGVSGIGPSIFLEGFQIRPFSTLVSPQEYAAVLASGLVLVWSRVLAGGTHRKGWTGAFVLILVAQFLQGSRGIFVFVMATMVLMALLRYRSVMLSCFALGVLLLLVLIGSTVNGEIEVGDGQPWTSVEHQLNGIFNPSSSTLPLHQSLVASALKRGIDEPLGLGVGNTSVAGIAAEEGVVSAEQDLGTLVVALGAPSGLVFLALVLMAVGSSIRRFWWTGRAFDLATVGVLVVLVNQWLGASLYAAQAFLWLTIGSLARPHSEALDRAEAEREAEAAEDAAGAVRGVPVRA